MKNVSSGNGTDKNIQENTVTSRDADVSRGIDAYRKAVALSYDGSHAPEISAAGSGDIAEEIIAIARQYGVPLYENRELVELLSLLELGEEVPQEVYVIVAQLIALAYKIKNGAANSAD